MSFGTVTLRHDTVESKLCEFTSVVQVTSISAGSEINAVTKTAVYCLFVSVYVLWACAPKRTQAQFPLISFKVGKIMHKKLADAPSTLVKMKNGG